MSVNVDQLYSGVPMEGTLEEPPIKDSSQASSDKHLKAIFLRTTNIHFSVCFISSAVQKLTSV
ncbi:hypothetical protein E2986_12993 [Frieseomelitta varia]|uniref:Uncharacterized protein n=1 Tax=Frieseomelitta varia TaxID=561572 RepID=A0A833RSD3_9HYME|nr:hypothetical protein E2986_12993 [Frieseomelitta varia]